jgi:hypothetical protein|tara:strand:- start:75648 stop:77000 length:1353 start_codon:yes stop_codon:yes gene_type:complete
MIISLKKIFLLLAFSINFVYSQEDQENQLLIDSVPSALNQKAIESAANRALYRAGKLEAELELKSLIDSEQFLDAIPLAEEIVLITEDEFGPSKELALTLNNLGQIKNKAKLFNESEEHFLRSIEIFRDIEGFYSESTIMPLIGLGISNQNRDNYYEAISIFNEARTVSRRIYGLLNEDQIEIMRHLSNVMVKMENYEGADEVELEAFQLMERVHGSETMSFLPGLYRYADWLRRSYRFDEARFIYSRAIAIVTKNEGGQNKALIKPLLEIASSYRDQKLNEGRGIGALKEALEVAESQENIDTLTTVDILISIGDWYTAFNRVNNDRNEYTQAWDLLGIIENAEELRNERFNEPKYVLRENPTSRGLTEPTDPEAEPGKVLIMFDVSEVGRASNIEIIESVPPGLKDASTIRAIRRSRFRPRIIDGKAVSTEKVLRNFSFHYPGNASLK